jgi:GDPmannose 4,6-dehydratase
MTAERPGEPEPEAEADGEAEGEGEGAARRAPTAGRAVQAEGAAGARRALITGITGQDGSFLAELLLGKGYAVTGVARGGGGDRRLGCSEHLRGRIEVLEGDLLDPGSLRAALQRTRPHELYHLGAPSLIPDSWRRPRETIEAIAGATATLLEAVRDDFHCTRVFVASSAAMFGQSPQSPQDELTPCAPVTPYAVAKLAAHRLAGAMREHDGLWVSCGILFNHESERAQPQLAARAVTRAAARVKLGLAGELELRSPRAVRDWSFAGDVMRGAWLALRQQRPDDYVLASGVGRTVAELARTAFACVGLDAQPYIRLDSTQARAPEPTPSVGDPGRARTRLGWRPTLDFEQLIRRMVDAELAALRPART